MHVHGIFSFCICHYIFWAVEICWWGLFSGSGFKWTSTRNDILQFSLWHKNKKPLALLNCDWLWLRWWNHISPWVPGCFCACLSSVCVWWCDQVRRLADSRQYLANNSATHTDSHTHIIIICLLAVINIVRISLGFLPTLHSRANALVNWVVFCMLSPRVKGYVMTSSDLKKCRITMTGSWKWWPSTQKRM